MEMQPSTSAENSPETVSVLTHERRQDSQQEDIKKFAESTMNEMLGWYGYTDTRKPRDRKSNTSCDKIRDNEKTDNVCPEEASPDPDHERNEPAETPSHNATGSCNVDDESSETMTTPPEEPDRKHSDDTVNGGTDEIHLRLSDNIRCVGCSREVSKKDTVMDALGDASDRFCTLACLAQYRTKKTVENTSEAKTCEWCKAPCDWISCLQFKDGDVDYCFCKTKCLNEFKMKIFCQETEEHLKMLRSKEADESAPPVNGVEGDTKKIVITPKLWAGEDGANGKTSADDRRKRALYEVPDAEVKESHQPPPKRMHVHKVKCEVKAVVDKNQRATVKVGSGQRPPRMTDREKIKQIRMRDKLPLYTPLRESNRGMDSSYTVNSNSTITRGHLSLQGRNIHGCNTVEAGASARSSVTDSCDMPLSMYYNTLSQSDDRRLSTESSGSELSDSLHQRPERASSHTSSVSQTRHSAAPNFAPPPIYPPQNPFTPHFPFLGLPYPLNMGGSNPLGFPPLPPGLPLLSQLNPSNMMQPNSANMPYPFILPLPLPVPVPVPVMSDSLYLRVRLAADKLSTRTSKQDHSPTSTTRVKSESRATDDRLTPADTRATSETFSEQIYKAMLAKQQAEPRYILDPRPMPDLDSDQDHDGAIDLSLDRCQSEHSDAAPLTMHSPSDNAPSPILIQPITSDDSSNSSLPTSQSGVSQDSPATKYSARRNLILDAPSEGPINSGSEKNMSSAFQHEILSHRKRQTRLRIKTK